MQIERQSKWKREREKEGGEREREKERINGAGCEKTECDQNKLTNKGSRILSPTERSKYLCVSVVS